MTEDGSKMRAIATLTNPAGGVAHWAVDGNCYVLYLKQCSPPVPVGHSNRKYSAWRFGCCPYIFPEAFKVLKTLPPLK